MRDTGPAAAPGPSRAAAAATISTVVGAPLALLAVLLRWPALDVQWEHQPAHFWLVLAAAAATTALGYNVSVAARRRGDARLLLVSLAFMSGAGFLGLHALATPGVLVGPNTGFHLATPIGLALGSVFVALSTAEMGPEASRRLMARADWLLGGLLVLFLAWAAMSLAEAPPLHGPTGDETLQGWQVSFAVLGVAGYGVGSWGYLRLHQRRRQPFVLAVAEAFALLAATMVVVAFSANWRLSWWEWHVLMLVSFIVIAAAARRQWHEERFSALYLEQTLAGTTEASVLFADLQGFTTFSERATPAEVQTMLGTYFSRLVPLLRRHGGQVHQLIGDAIMVVFNTRGDQPDHAALAAQAALAMQAEASAIADAHPGWPRFRAGINSGEVAAGVLGGHGHRKHDIVGDTVNLAARLESEAPVGGVLIGQGTLERLPAGAVVEALPPLQVKGKERPVAAYVLEHLAE